VRFRLLGWQWLVHNSRAMHFDVRSVIGQDRLLRQRVCALLLSYCLICDWLNGWRQNARRPRLARGLVVKRPNRAGVGGVSPSWHDDDSSAHV